MKVIFASLHGPLFLNGTNLSATLDVSRKEGLSMVIDRCQNVTMLHVTYKGRDTWVPFSNIVNFTGEEAPAPKVTPVPQVRGNATTLAKSGVSEG
jgi:hypothetical protein